MIEDITDKSPNHQTIEMLRGLLAQAESGELRTLVALCGYIEGQWNNCWSLDPRTSRRKLLGESALLHHDLLTKQALDDGDSVLSEALR